MLNATEKNQKNKNGRDEIIGKSGDKTQNKKMDEKEGKLRRRR